MLGGYRYSVLLPFATTVVGCTALLGDFQSGTTTDLDAGDAGDDVAMVETSTDLDVVNHHDTGKPDASKHDSGKRDVETDSSESESGSDASEPVETGTTLTLSVNITGTGTGTVTFSPSATKCTTSCTRDFDAGTSVILTATASSGSLFAGWAGGGCSGLGTCTVPLDAMTTVTATFGVPAVWDPTYSIQGTNQGVTYSNGNLSIVANANIDNNSANFDYTANVRTTIGVSSGKWYWEITATGGNTAVDDGGLGILGQATPTTADYIGDGSGPGLAFGYGTCCPDYYDSSWTANSAYISPSGTSAVSSGVVYMFALDVDNGLFWAGEGGTWYNGGDPSLDASDPNYTAHEITGTVYPAVTFYDCGVTSSGYSCGNSLPTGYTPNSFTANFGGSPFANTVPTGFHPGLY
jgi:hypothetical protein